MSILIKSNSQRGNAFVKILLCLAIVIGACLVVYNNKDFQRANKKQITKFNYYMRDYVKAYKDFTKDFGGKIAEWKKSLPFKSKDHRAEKPLESYTFEELVFDNATLEKTVPAEMLRHQPDEITICSFDADLVLNNPLTDKEIIHLANIIRFCELSVISKIQNENFLKRLSVVLKLLRYNSVYEIIPAPGVSGKTLSAYLYRDDKIQPLEKIKTYKDAHELAIQPIYAPFKTGDFDLIIASFATPPTGTALDSIAPLDNFFEAAQNAYPTTQDIIIFGDFAFESRGMIWDSASLLPTIARALPADRAPLDLLGNLWFRKKELVEFNGKFGLINLTEEMFPSQRKPPVTANKPIWVQFKIMPDDD